MQKLLKDTENEETVETIETVEKGIQDLKQAISELKSIGMKENGL